MYPRILHIYGPLWIQSYGLMILLGVAVFLFLTYRHPVRKHFIAEDTYFNTIFLGLMAGIVGGRILYVLTEWQQFADNWLEVFYPWTGGFAILGAILGLLIAVPLYLRMHNVAILPMLDLTAVYGPLTQAIGRFGCLLAGCCYGKPAFESSWWTTTFTHCDGYLPLDMIGIPLYATQLYACIASLLIFLIMLCVMTRYCKRPGQLAAIYLVLENSARFGVDFWRADQATMYEIPGFAGLVLSDMQLLAIALGVFGVGLFVVVTRYGTALYGRMFCVGGK